MKLSVSAFRAQASAQRKILSSYQNQLNYGACTSFPALGGYKFEEKLRMMVDTTGINPASAAKPEEGTPCSENSGPTSKEEEGLEPKEPGGTEAAADPGRREEGPASDKSPGRTRSKSNQRWMKLRTTVQLSGAISSTNQKSKPPLKREDSFLKRFSTRQIPETQETVDTGDETETLNGSQTQNEVNRRRRKRRKEMSKTVVNPDENFYFYWLMTVTVCVLYNLWTLIVRQSFPELQEAASGFWYSGDGFTDVVFVCDVVVQFRTGYLEQGLMVYDSKKLATHYLKSRAFLLDVLSLLPLDFLQLNVGVNPMLRFPRFLKIYRVYSYYYMVESRTVYPNLWRVVNLIHILLILAHWFGCFYYLLSEAEGFQGDWVYPHRSGDYATLTRKYLGSLYWSTLTLTTIGDLPTPETNAESRGRGKAMTSSGRSEAIPRRGHKSRLLQFSSNYGYLFTIVSYLIGVFIFATIVGQVGNVITNRNANRLEFERLLDGAKTYMRHHKVPGGMKRRVLRWYDYSWSRGRIQGGGDINTALGLLPDKLKTELALHVNLSVLKKVTIFQECQPEFLHDLVLKMKAYIFTPGDLICRKGEVAREMFIIADGILDVISDTGRVLTTMKAGDFFGEIGILNLDGLNKRTADVRSVGYSELFSLSREDVLAAMKDYPEAQEILQSLGRKRLMEAKNASKMHKAQAKPAKDHDSSGESDTAGKRIVEKLRSDVKGLKNALRRSRRGTRTKESSERAAENPGRKTANKKHSILRRMSHVQSSDEYEANNDVEQSPIGAGLPLLQRLKLLKEKQEREREEKESSKSRRDENVEGGPTTTAVPFAEKFKLHKQKETKAPTDPGTAAVSSTVRTQVTGVRFDKPTSKPRSSAREAEKKVVRTKANKEDAESERTSSAERLDVAPPRHEKISRSGSEGGTIPGVDFASESETETSVGPSGAREMEDPVPKSLRNKPEVPKSKDGWRLLRNSSISRPQPDKELKNEGSDAVEKASKRTAYLSKSDTVLEKQKSREKEEEKRSRSASPSGGVASAEEDSPQKANHRTGERKRPGSTGSVPRGQEAPQENAAPWPIPSSRSPAPPPTESPGGNKRKMKKYNSISDLSPEYSGLPFVKKLKILNERQKLEELEKELLVRSVSLDGPERPATRRDGPLVRSHSEASAVAPDRRPEPRGVPAGGEGPPGPADPRSQLGDDKAALEKSERSRIHWEGSVASPENNETVERRHLKSILKKLSTEEATSDGGRGSRGFGRGCGRGAATPSHAEFRKLMRAPTVEGYAARHKKLTKSVTFDGDALPGSPNPVAGQPSEESRGKSFSPTGPTAISTLRPLPWDSSATPGGGPEADEEEERLGRVKEEKNAAGVATEAPRPEMGESSREEGQNDPSAAVENFFMPCILREVIEKNLRTLPCARSLDDDFFSEISRRILQVFQRLLEEVENRFRTRFGDLQIEVEKRDEIILRLRSKIQELEVSDPKRTADRSETEDQRNAEGGGKSRDATETSFPGGHSSRDAAGGPPSPPTQSASDCPPAGDPAASSEREDVCGNVEDPASARSGTAVRREGEATEEEEDDASRLSQITPTETAQRLLGLVSGGPSGPPPAEEVELAERRGSLRWNDSKRKRRRMEFRSVGNFSVDESALPRTRKRQRFGGSAKSGDGSKLFEFRTKTSFINRVAKLQRTFSCSQEKTGDFVALDIDDGSDSSDSENFHNKDWEVEMLVEELGKKDFEWETAGEKWSSDADVKRSEDVTKLLEEVDALKQMVCDADLNRLTSSELDILESIIESKDQKISRLAESNSLDDDEDDDNGDEGVSVRCSERRDGRPKKCERRKGRSLRQRLGHALSFDFHDIQRRKSKSHDDVEGEAFFLGKQKAIRRSARERRSLRDSRHSSGRPRRRAPEDSDRPPEARPTPNSCSGSPTPIRSFSQRESAHDPGTGPPTFAAQEPLGLPRGRSRDSVFEEPETSREATPRESQHFAIPSASELAGPKDRCPGSVLNNFIKSVGQKVKQAVVGDSNAVRNQVPTISKLCDERPTPKTSSEDSGGAPSEGKATPEKDDPPGVSDSFDRRSKTDPPDL